MSDEEAGGDSSDRPDRHGANYEAFLVCLLVHVFLLDGCVSSADRA